nr:glycoside hydrolase family 97 catalytic domain-containing protein [Haliscomenobacter sp.]
MTPDHDLLLPFIRQPSGPMDYEPGGLDNASKNLSPHCRKSDDPGDQGSPTGVVFVYESPYEMFSGNPSAAWLEPKYMEFLGSFPIPGTKPGFAKPALAIIWCWRAATANVGISQPLMTGRL